MKQNILGDKKKSSFDDNLANVVNEIYDKMPDVVPENKVIVPSDFLVEEFDHVYVLSNVRLRDEILKVYWLKNLLDVGLFAHDLDYWNKFTQNLEYKVPTVELYFASLLALYENRNGPQAELIEEIRKIFCKDFKKPMMTNTRIVYKNHSPDTITHYYEKLKSDRSIDTFFTGPCQNIKNDADLTEEMESLLGVPDQNKVNEVFKWVTDKETFLYRGQNKPEKDDERVVVLSIENNYDFDIYAWMNPDSKGYARGANFVKTGEDGSFYPRWTNKLS